MIAEALAAVEAWAVDGGWLWVLWVASIAATVAIVVPATARLIDSREQPVHPAVTFDPAYVAQLDAARAHADTCTQELQVLRGINRALAAEAERQLEAERARSERLRQRALRAARSNRMARAVLDWELGMKGVAVRRRAREIGFI